MNENSTEKRKAITICPNKLIDRTMILDVYFSELDKVISTRVCKMEMMTMFLSNSIGKSVGVDIKGNVIIEFVYTHDSKDLSFTLCDCTATEFADYDDCTYGLIGRLKLFSDDCEFKHYKHILDALTDYIPDMELRKDLVYRAYISHSELMNSISESLAMFTIEPIQVMAKLVENRIINLSDIPIDIVLGTQGGTNESLMRHYANGVYTVYDMLTKHTIEYRHYLTNYACEYFDKYYELGVGL